MWPERLADYAWADAGNFDHDDPHVTNHILRGYRDPYSIMSDTRTTFWEEYHGIPDLKIVSRSNDSAVAESVYNSYSSAASADDYDPKLNQRTGFECRKEANSASIHYHPDDNDTPSNGCGLLFSSVADIPLDDSKSERILAWTHTLPDALSLDNPKLSSSAEPIYIPPKIRNLMIAAAASSMPSSPSKLYDSGASHHMSPYRDDFVTFKSTMPCALLGASNSNFMATGVGDVIIRVPNHDNFTEIRLTNVLYTPSVTFSLISVGCLDDAGYFSTFGGGQAEIRRGDGDVIGRFPKKNGLYRIFCDKPSAHAADSADNRDKPDVLRLTPMEFHRRMGHISLASVKKLVKDGLVKGVELIESDEPLECTACIQAKSKHKTDFEDLRGQTS